MDRPKTDAKPKSWKKPLAAALILALVGGGGFAFWSRKGATHAAHAAKGEEHGSSKTPIHVSIEREGDEEDEHEHEEDSEHAHQEASPPEDKDAEKNQHAEKSAHGEKALHADAANEAESEHDEHSEINPFKQIPKKGLIDTYWEAIKSIQAKVDKIEKTTEENERLRLENANLRLQNESLQFSCSSRDAQKESREISSRLSGDTGALAGRTLASIQYDVPTHLLPDQLFTLGVTYFNGGEYEKAAKVLTFLTEMEDGSSFRTPRNLVLVGVTWYRLENYRLAEAYFDRVLEVKSADAKKYQAQARLWRGLAAEKQKKHGQAQAWLKQIIEHHPRSTEADWVNPQEVGRAPAKATEQAAPHHD